MRVKPFKVQVNLPERVYDGKEFAEQCTKMNGTYSLQLQEPADRGIRGFFKRLVFNMVLFILKPLCERQEAFNEATVRTMNQVLRFVSENDGAEKRAYAAVEQAVQDADAQMNELHTVITLRQDRDRDENTEIFDAYDVRMERLMSKVIELEEEVRVLKQQLNDRK